MAEFPRTARIDRKTAETEVHLSLALDGSGKAEIATGIGFLDHMLVLLAAHSRFDLIVRAVGDLHVDDHHTTEDVGICLGQALREAVGGAAGIGRYGQATVPMDESLVSVAIDWSGRSAFVWKVAIPTQKVGTFDTELAGEFFNALASNARMALHVVLHHGGNSHHIIEATFKATARALRQATALDASRKGEIPSTKGVLG